MTKEELNKHIGEIIDISFERLAMIYKNNIYGKTINVSRLLFPHIRENGNIRVSEQELRFIFVEVFNEYCKAKSLNLYYSIETPTIDTYSFKGENKQCDEGQSAMFDLVIFDEHYNRRALLEFKAKNASFDSHEKDMVKLLNPKEGSEDVLRYFIEILENYNNGTIKSLSTKFEGCDSVNKKIYSLSKEEALNIRKS